MGDTTKARAAALEPVSCKFCRKLFAGTNIGKHEGACLDNPAARMVRKKTCSVCSSIFYGRGVTCSRACANKNRH